MPMWIAKKILAPVSLQWWVLAFPLVLLPRHSPDIFSGIISCRNMVVPVQYKQYQYQNQCLTVSPTRLLQESYKYDISRPIKIGSIQYSSRTGTGTHMYSITNRTSTCGWNIPYQVPSKKVGSIMNVPDFHMSFYDKSQKFDFLMELATWYSTKIKIWW